MNEEQIEGYFSACLSLTCGTFLQWRVMAYYGTSVRILFLLNLSTCRRQKLCRSVWLPLRYKNLFLIQFSFLFFSGALAGNPFDVDREFLKCGKDK